MASLSQQAGETVPFDSRRFRPTFLLGGCTPHQEDEWLGGVIQILTVQPERTRVRATIDGGSHDTFRGSVFAGAMRNGWAGTAGFEGVRTDGAFVVAPEARGPTDTKADIGALPKAAPSSANRMSPRRDSAPARSKTVCRNRRGSATRQTM